MLMTVLKGDLAIAQNKVLNHIFMEMKEYISKNCALIGMVDIARLAIQTGENTAAISENNGGEENGRYKKGTRA